MEPSIYHRAAIAAHKSGLAVMPSYEDGTKRPLGEWKEYMTARPTPDQIDKWYGYEHRHSVGVICGSVSDNLTMLEAENDSLYQLLRDNADATGLGDLLDRIEQGWSERSPGTGVHLYYKCSDIRGNKKLARRPYTDDNGAKKVETLIETKGEGGFTIIAPSGGKTHQTGRSYDIMYGGPRTVATITPEEQRDLWQLCSVFDEMEVPQAHEPAPVGSLRPGDDYNSSTSWREILEPHGWRFVFERGGVWYLRRPGKDRGISATVNWHGLDLFRNFSSSTPFEDRAYTKFAVYSILEHQGDFRAAAKSLARDGFGSRDKVFSSVNVEDEAEEFVQTWRDPDPIERPGFPAFPVHHLPESIRGFCRSVADSVQVPPDYPAQTMLATLSAACRGRFEIGIGDEGYSEPLVLQTVLFARSGTRKSASFAHVKKPLIQYERRARPEAERRHRVWQDDVERLERDLKKAKNGAVVNYHAVQDMYGQLDNLKRSEPVVTRIVADDITPERMGTLIVEQQGPIAIMAPEGGFFGNIAGRYNSGIPNLEYVLRGHAGEALVIDRMGREAFVPSAFVTLGISLQPSLLDEFAATPGFSGKGMAARLLPSFPASMVGKRDVRRDEPVDPDEYASWYTVITGILNDAEDCATDSYGDYIPYRMVLSKQAQELYYAYAEHIERQLGTGGGLHAIDDWGGKLLGHALRIAGLFHLCTAGARAYGVPVSRQTLADAIAVMEYYVPHARYMMNRIRGINYGAHLDELLTVLRGEDGVIYRSMLVSRLKSSNHYRGNRDYIDDALDELELMGYCRIVQEGRKTRVELNPEIESEATYLPFTVNNAQSSGWVVEIPEEDYV